jgi:nicotinamidase-related amidase
MPFRTLPVPPHFDADNVGAVWRVPYQERATEARRWAETHGIPPASEDEFRLGLLAVDIQNTFCVPDFELFVAGRSGTGAVDDNRRLCEFIYRNLASITGIIPTLDTHTIFQVFHAPFLVDPDGNHPAPFAQVTAADVATGRWRFNDQIGPTLGIDPADGQRHLVHYVESLAASGKFALTVWPYHAMLGGVSHALVAAVEEAIFFHGLARRAQADFHIKGRHPLTEHYSVLGPEVTTDAGGRELAARDETMVERLLGFDAVIIAGQAKSHCIAWTIEDLLEEVIAGDARLARRVYLLEDCTSPVVVPGADYTDEADAAFRRFADAGMHVVRSTDPLPEWPDLLGHTARSGT